MHERTAASNTETALGCLYLVGTPSAISKTSLSAHSASSRVDQIACEDTRHTQKLLNHY
jgi:16S rRNA C1402 (ribose-2'-O) methylase RsmI